MRQRDPKPASIDESQPHVRLIIGDAQLVQLYTAIGDQLSQLNAKSNAIRAIASAWLLGAIGAAGWALSLSPDPDLVADPSLIAPFLLSMGAIGLITLWYVDRVFVYRLVEASFLVGVALERGHPEKLPPVMRLMSRTTTSRVMHRYYLAPAGIMSCVGLGLIGGAWWPDQGKPVANVALMVLSVLSFATVIGAGASVSILGRANKDQAIEHWERLCGDDSLLHGAPVWAANNPEGSTPV